VNGKALAVIIGAIVIVVGGVVGGAIALTSGDDDDQGKDDNSSTDPGDASVEEFCAPYQDYIDSFTSVDFSAPEEEQLQTLVGAIKDYAAAVDDVGAPDDMPDDAREGMEFLVGWADDLDPADFTSVEDFDNFDEQFSEDEKAAGDAFFAYVDETCGGVPTDVPSDLPTDIPSDLPTDLPSDLPTELLTDLPTDFLSGIPSEYLTMLPSDFLSGIPSEYLTMLPSEFLTLIPTE
jgi:hypothetical protein